MPREPVSSPAYRAVADALTRARVRAGLTQRALALRLGRPPSLVANLELGERRIDVVELVRLAEALGEDPRALVAEVVDAVASAGAGEGSGSYAGRR